MTESTTQPAKNRPGYHAFNVRENGDKPSYWTRIGVAWKHADGDGFHLQLDAIPIDGQIIVRVASAKPN